ncbi:hypothetical protein SETIT_8G016900v2 [Setaria italica]|uniref:DRBM domain-containing protein n=1 Tax=Setaria italica TaxID=4555 RepID=A0A368S3D5_SETIT|nr:hypothetical protein SETIT_8G016900v2 [Setaria italica]
MNLAPAPNVAAAPVGIRVENCYVFKSRLQEYAQKAGLPTQEYHTLKEGPSHEPIFKSTVVINNTKYDSLPGFFSRKAAEQSAAEVALMEIVKSVPATETKSIPAVQETGLCKNLLQEYAQKMNYTIHHIFALNKLQATDKRPTETPKSLKVKKSGGRKKWNKWKFMRKTDQIVDAEKDGAREAGDVHDSDVPMQATIITEEPSRDTMILHLDEEARRVELELLRETATQQPDKEARSVKQGIAESLNCAEVVKPNMEARSVEQESASGYVALQFNGGATDVKEEPPSNSVMMQCEETETIKQEVPRGELL